MSRAPQTGEIAPDFTLEGTDGTFTLSEQRGRPVVLLFYPGDETLVCTKQFCSYRDHADDLASVDAVVVGVSGQSVASHEAFRDRHGLTVGLLADTEKAVASAYGVAAPVLGTRRAIVIVDALGVIAYRKVYLLGLAFPTAAEISRILGDFPATEPA